MKKILLFLIMLMTIPVLPCCSNAGGVDDVLNNAKKQGKVVMLELGSVGCIPCEAGK